MPVAGMNCQRPAALARESASGWNALSTNGRSASSVGMPTILDLLKNVIEVAPRALEHAVQIVRLAAVVLGASDRPCRSQGQAWHSLDGAVPDVNRRTECLNRADQARPKPPAATVAASSAARHACSRNRLRNARCGLEKQKGESETKKGQRFQQKRTNLKRSDHGAKKWAGACLASTISRFYQSY